MRTSSARLFAACIGVLTLSSAGQTQEPELVTVARIFDATGQSRGRTGVRANRPPVPTRGTTGTHSSYFYDNQNVRDENGLIISGLGVQAWRDGSDVRVAVYLHVPGPGAPNAYLAGKETAHLIRPRRLVEFVLEVGEQREIVELKRFGLKPWTIKLLRERR